MKLSEAILLGDTLKKAEPRFFLSCDGSCGCALGGAALAIGVRILVYPTGSPGFMAAFPWFKAIHSAEIGMRYAAVCDGKMTLEQLCDYVRSIEPAEPTISILPSRKPLVRIPEGSDQGDEQPEWDDTDTSRELYSGIQRGCQ